jgi:hypothetical protein
MIKTMLGLLVGAWFDCAQAELLSRISVRVRKDKIFIGA